MYRFLNHPIHVKVGSKNKKVIILKTETFSFHHLVGIYKTIFGTNFYYALVIN